MRTPFPFQGRVAQTAGAHPAHPTLRPGARRGTAFAILASVVAFGARSTRRAVTALLLVAACDPINPWLFAVRDHVVMLIVGLAAATLSTTLYAHRAQRIGRFETSALTVMLIAAALLSVIQGTRFAQQREAVLAAPAGARAIGHRFMVGYRSFEEVAPLAERGLIGGIYLTRRNVRDRDIAAIRAEIDALQTLRARAGLPPLLVAADQEGGPVAHMSPPLSAPPAIATLVAEAAVSDDGAHALTLRARAYGEAKGAELAALGINLNFGPVVDLRPDGRGPTLDTHTLIRRRAISADPTLVATVARAYADGLHSHGVGATLKHFPGLARVTVDTHHFPARLDTPVTTLADHDWHPFRHAARADGAIMLGHVILTDLDPEHPASTSPAVVRTLLREEWGYDGLLVTDDLNMGAVHRLGPCRATLAALAAGVDVLLLSYDPDQFHRAMHCALTAQRAGHLSPEENTASARRMAALTQSNGAPRPVVTPGPSTPSSTDQSQSAPAPAARTGHAGHRIARRTTQPRPW